MAEYEPIDMSELAGEIQRVSKDNNQFLDKFVKLPEGEGFVTMRILPRRRGQQLYCATRTHRLGHGQDARSFHCPRELVKTPNGDFWVATEEHGDCVVCRYCKNLWQKSMKLADKSKAQKELQEAYRKIKATERFYYNVIARTQFDKKTNKVQENVGPLIFSCGQKVHKMILTAIMGDVKAGKKSKGDITDPKTGRDFRLVKKVEHGASGTYPSYDTSEFEEPSAAGNPDEWNKWIENLHDLTQLRTLKDHATLDHALKVHLGVAEPDAKPNAGGGENDDWSEYEGNSKVSASVPEGIEDVIGTNESKPAIVKQDKPAAAKAKADEDAIMADPKFMAEIEGLNADD